MMGEAANILAGWSPGLVQHVLALEGFLLHYRNLLDFYAPRHQQPTDIVWSHFVTDRVAVADEHRWDLKKWLAHLTTERLQAFEGKRKGWPVDRMWDEMEARSGRSTPDTVSQGVTHLTLPWANVTSADGCQAESNRSEVLTEVPRDLTRSRRYVRSSAATKAVGSWL